MPADRRFGGETPISYHHERWEDAIDRHERLALERQEWERVFLLLGLLCLLIGLIAHITDTSSLVFTW